MWWEILERIVKQHDQISVTVDGHTFDHKTRTTEEKYNAFNEIYWALRKLPHKKQYSEVEKIVEQFNFDWSRVMPILFYDLGSGSRRS